MPSVDTDLEISNRAIRNARMRAGLSIVELAAKVVPPVAPKTLYDIEAGSSCRISTVRRIAEALGVAVEELLVAVPVVPADEGVA